MPFKIETEDRKFGKIATLTMEGIAPNNTLNREMLVEFFSIMKDTSAKADGIIVTSANEKFFSNGLDGATLLGLDREERKATVEEMIRIYGKLFSIDKPWIAEIAGHAMAGGAVIATAADNRFMLAGSGRIGFSEMMVGMPLPAAYVMGFKNLVQPKYIRDVLYGAAYKPEEALEIGLIDEIAVDKESLRKMSYKKLDFLLRLNRKAFLMTRMLYRNAIIADIARVEDADVEAGGSAAMSDEFTAILENIAKRN